MTEREHEGRAWIAPGVTALLGFIGVCVVCWPGFMSPDSVEQLVQARAHVFSDDHPPLMGVLWALVDPLLPGPAGMLLLLNGLYWGGLLVCFRYWPASARGRALCFALVAAFPPLLVNLGVIWKDILMQGALVALLAAYLRYRRAHGLVALALALVFSLIAIGARHNAAAAVWPLLALVVAAHPRWPGAWARWRRITSAALVAFGLVVVLQQGLTYALRPFVRQTHFWQVIALFDLAGMSVSAGELLIEPSTGMLRPGNTLEDLQKSYNPRHPGSLFYPRERKSILRSKGTPEQRAAIARNWWRAVRTHPRAYFESRLRIYQHLIGVADTQPAYMVFAEIDHNPYGYRLKKSSLRDGVVSTFERLSETPLFSVWLYVVACCLLFLIGAAALWGGGSPLALALSASGLLYHFTFAVLAASDDYRYSLWTISCALLSACALPASLPERWRQTLLRARGAGGQRHPSASPGSDPHARGA